MEHRPNRAFTRMVTTFLVVILSFSTTLVAARENPADPDATGKAWKFRVYLDDKEIGYHHFYLSQSGETRQVRTTASFEYRLMFVPLFNYEHENHEIWNGNCLQSISSRTDSNGEAFRIDGRRENGEFRLEGTKAVNVLPECIMTFAYWDPAFLRQSRLLNSQDGEYMSVDVSAPVASQLEIDGVQTPADRYRLTAGKLKLDLWYSDRREWLGLESEVKGGRKLRYELDDTAGLQAGQPAQFRAAGLAGEPISSNRSGK